MDIITLTPENISQEHICCAISDKKGDLCAATKKAWLLKRFDDGLVFKKMDVRGKAFIEYIPAESAWAPIEAEGYFFINCFWVSGQHKGKGYANDLLSACIDDAKEKGRQGLVLLSSEKKKPFLFDSSYAKYKGFALADTAPPYYTLLYLPLQEGAVAPKFRACAKQGVPKEKGFVLFYTDQCPHTAKYVPLLKETVEHLGRSVTLHRLASAQEAQSAPNPFTTYALFLNGEFVTNEILSKPKIEKLVKG